MTSAELLAACKRLAKRPATDAATTDPDWYAFLTDAEARWKPVIALHAPGPMLTAPMKLTAAGDGRTFTFPSSAEPIYVELYRSERGQRLVPGAYDDPGADYVLEGSTVRATAHRQPSYPDGAPWARYVTAPATINAATQSTINPARLRILLVYHACGLWASRGALMDPAHFERLEQQAAFGNPNIPGDLGLIGALKWADPASGMAAFRHDSEPYAWWRPNG